MNRFNKPAPLSLGLAVLGLTFIPRAAHATPPTNIVFTGPFSGTFATVGTTATGAGNGTTTNYSTANEALSDTLSLISAGHYSVSGTDVFTFTGSSPYVGQTLTANVSGLYTASTEVMTGVLNFVSSSFGSVSGSSSFTGTFSQSTHNYNITYTAIPEPAPYLAFGLGAVSLAALALRTRRRGSSLV